MHDKRRAMDEEAKLKIEKGPKISKKAKEMAREKERNPDKLYRDGARIRRAIDKKGAGAQKEEIKLELTAKYKMKNERLNVDERYRAKVAEMQMQVPTLVQY